MFLKSEIAKITSLPFLSLQGYNVKKIIHVSFPFKEQDVEITLPQLYH